MEKKKISNKFFEMKKIFRNEKKNLCEMLLEFFLLPILLLSSFEKEEENLINCGTLYIDLVTVLQINNMWDEIFSCY